MKQGSEGDGKRERLGVYVFQCMGVNAGFEADTPELRGRYEMTVRTRGTGFQVESDTQERSFVNHPLSRSDQD